MASDNQAKELWMPTDSTAEPRGTRSAASAANDSSRHGVPSPHTKYGGSDIQSHSPALVAIVDDHDACRASLIELLGALGLRAVGFENAAQLWSCDAHALHDWQLFLIDSRLGRESGIECVRELRQRGVGAPILVISAARPSSAEREVLDAVGAEWLAKPIAVAELRARSELFS